MSAPELARRWGLNVKQARYSEWGNFYGPLDRFPAALLDENGYYLIRELRDLEVDGISVGHKINVRGGISRLPGYVDVTNVLPEELPPGESLLEGARRTVTINAYERDRDARARCLQYWGTACIVCGFDFAKVYGAEYAGYIHVHHLVPLFGASIADWPQLQRRPEK